MSLQNWIEADMLKILSFTNKTKTVDDHNPLIIITLNVEQYDYLKTVLLV